MNLKLYLPYLKTPLVSTAFKIVTCKYLYVIDAGPHYKSKACINFTSSILLLHPVPITLGTVSTAQI